MAFTDGYKVVPMPPAQDHKRIFDQDKGPNTGGMGAYAPSPLISQKTLDEVITKTLQTAVDGMRKEGRPYVGVLYAGIILDPKGFSVLEYNCRFGDPETQVLLPLLNTDLLDIIEACVERRLDSINISWKEKVAVSVILASKGYPGSFEKGKTITGIDISHPNTILFHAGTSFHDDKIVTSGGRVLAITALGDSLKEAIQVAYEGVNKVHFDGLYFRKDIAYRALNFQKDKPITYEDAGVSINRGNSLVETIKPLVKKTMRPGSDCELGGFGGLFDLKATGYKDPILVSGTDGVGTKLLIALAAAKHDTIGIDLVAMSVNDIIVQGAEPLFFLDYYATGKLENEVAVQVIAGIAKACEESHCALIGGETAEMPGMYSPGKYDLAGFAVGIVEREQVLPKPVNVGDVLLGLASSGIHSNGYSLVRYILEKNKISYHDPYPFEEKTMVYEALLRPTRLYVKSCLRALKTTTGIKAFAHITGGGLLENVPRVYGNDVAAEIDLASWQLPSVFRWLSKLGNIQSEELIRTFNCGIGMVVIVSSNQVSHVTKILEESGEKVFIIGKMIKRKKYDIEFIHQLQ